MKITWVLSQKLEEFYFYFYVDGLQLTHYYNDTNSARTGHWPNIPTSGGGMSSNCIGSPRWGSPRPVPGLVDWLIQMLHPSAIWGTIFSTLVSADVQVFSMVFTFGACSSSILGAHHTGDRGGARTLDPCVSSFVIVLIPRFIFASSRLSDRGCWGKPRFPYHKSERI